MVGHGLEATAENPWVRRILKRTTKSAEKKWAEEHQSKHAPANDDAIVASDNHDIPIQATFEQLFTEIWHKADQPVAPEHAAFYQLAENEARHELQRTLDANAMLTLPPDDFMRLYSEMQKVAHEMVRETRDLAAGAGKTQFGTNVLREKVRNTVQKFIGGKHSPTHVNCVHAEGSASKHQATAPTLSHVCGIELRAPTLFHPHS